MLVATMFSVAFLASIFGSEALNITEVCPYNTYCSSGPLKSWTPDGIYRPCCENCLCSEDCGLFGKCCFDFEPKKNLETIHKCYTQDELYNIPRNINSNRIMKGFVIINTCPEDYPGNASCLEMQEFEDFVSVSGKLDGHIYVNRKCALCNGVEDVVEWNLSIINCPFIMVQKFNSSDHFEAAVLEHCRLYSTPPLSIYENAIKYECAGTRALSTACLLVESENNGAFINEHEKECQTGHEFPFVYYLGKLYRNPYCLHCVDNMEFNADICEDEIWHVRSDFTQLTLILSTKVEPKEKPKCGASEMFDPSQETCIHLYCPTFYIPDSGVCVPFARDSFNFGMQLTWSAVTKGPIADSNKFGSLLLSFFKKHISLNENKNENSNRCNLKMFGIAQSDENDAYITIIVEVITTKRCTLYDVLSDAKNFRELAALQTFNFTSVDISLSNITVVDTFNELSARYIYIKSFIPGFLELFPVTIDILEECPSVEINVRQHPLRNTILKYIQKGKLKSDENMLRLCVKDYLALISSSGHYLVSKTTLLLCLIFTVCCLSF